MLYSTLANLDDITHDPVVILIRLTWECGSFASQLHARTEHKIQLSALSPMKNFLWPVYLPTELELASPGWSFTSPGFHPP
jgi:hypothetical protein